MKILFSYFNQKGEKTEALEAVSIKENIYKVLQIPENALGISKGDEIEALVISDENLPEFIRFTQKSGNQTITINNFPSEQTKSKILKKLADEFCDFVELDDKVNVNILKIADLDEIQNLLYANEVSYQIMNPNPYEGKLVIPF